jgi:hypothetical protein
VPRRKMVIDAYTGRPLSKLAHLENFFGTDARPLLQGMFPDTNIANVNSMAAIVGKSPAHAEQVMLANPDLIHFHTLCVTDHRGRCLMTILQTHVSSLAAGFAAYEAKVLEGQIGRASRLRVHRT